MTDINLDCMSRDDLWLFWKKHRFASKASRLELGIGTGKGTVKAVKALASYAANKGTAMKCRELGDIQTAQMYEAICETIYADLPATLKW